MLQYNNVNLSINGNYILADSVDISLTSPQKPIFTMNNNIPYDNVPSNLNGTISISYFLEPGNEPNYPIITGILKDRTNVQPSVINIGNILTTGYITDYNLKLNPNSLIKISASFDIFNPITGIFTSQNINDSALYDTSNSSGIAHYWTAQFFSGNNVVTNNNILQLEYSVKINTTPIYGIGDNSPKQIYLDGADENFDILSETPYNLLFTGQLIDNIIPSLQNLVLFPITGITSNLSGNYISFLINGMILDDFKTNISINNIITYNATFNRYS